MDMKKMEEMKEKLMHELEMVGKKQQLALPDINMIDTLAHALKNLCKLMKEEQEGGQSQGSYGNSGAHYVRGHYSRDGGSYGGSYANNAYANAGGSYGSGGSYREAVEQAYSMAATEEERRVIGKMLDRM